MKTNENFNMYRYGSIRFASLLAFLVVLDQCQCLVHRSHQSVMPRSRHELRMIQMSMPEKDGTSWSTAKEMSVDKFQKKSTKRRVKKKYKRKRVPETEIERRKLTEKRQQEYEQIVSDSHGASIWMFESLFPGAVWDEETIDRDLYSVKRRDSNVEKSRQSPKDRPKMKTSAIGAPSMMRAWRDPKTSSFVLPYEAPEIPDAKSTEEEMTDEEAMAAIFEPSLEKTTVGANTTLSEQLASAAVNTNSSGRVDRQLTRMVEDRMYGYRRGKGSGAIYDTSLMGDGAVKFRDGVRLGNPLPVNAARLNYFAKKELRNNRVEEAQELYEEAVKVDPRDGRAYLGLSKCAERRRDFKLAREFLKIGVTNCVSVGPNGTPDSGGNPFLLQALGCLEEKAGHLSEAEALYIAAAKSRPCHAAAWVALAQLRTRKFRQSAAAGRACFAAAENELSKAGQPQSSHVYTAWASLEYKKAGNVRRARTLFNQALEIDPKCSAAWLQLGVMEANNGNWDEAERCFETVLKFDSRNSRVRQAYAIMESKKPVPDSRKVIDLFESALKVNPRDAGVLQPYALYVAELGDIDGARDLLRRGTEVRKRHAPVWQAWGVLETRHGNAEEARKIFQQGIWSCAQLGGGQSGGYNCARLWQAWGVLEAQEGDFAAARRCFSRALDADKRNIATMTAWTLMEEELGNYDDARILFERALKQFPPGTDEKGLLWRLYEMLEQRAENFEGAQDVYQRAMRESLTMNDDQANDDFEAISKDTSSKNADIKASEKKEDETEFEVSTWNQGSTSMRGEVWMNNGSIEGKVPEATMKKKRSKRTDSEY